MHSPVDWSELNQISSLPVKGLPGSMKALFPLPQSCMHPSASRTTFQMSNDDSVRIMPCYITALAFRAHPQHSPSCFLSTDSKASQSLSQPDSHAQPTSLCGETAVTGTKENGWFINPAFFMIYIRLWSFFLTKRVMEGRGGCQMHSPYCTAQNFYFEWWDYRFSVGKIGHTGQSWCVRDKKEKL